MLEWDTTSTCVSTSTTPGSTDIPTLVAEMNDRAVMILKMSRNEEARRLFTDALDILETSQRRRQAVTAPPKVGTFCTEGTSSSQLVMGDRPTASTHNLLVPPLSTRLPERSDQVSLPTGIYNRAFHICGDTETAGETSVRSVHLDVAVLSFNIALCYHLMGDNPHSLHRALIWYDQCAQHILLEERRAVWETYHTMSPNREDSPAVGSGCCRSLIVLLAAALCHNLAAIHGDHMFDIQRARSLRCQLAQVLHWEGGTLSLIETDDYVFFHLAMLFALLDDFRVAPAA